MDGIEIESNTRFAQNYIDSFFTKLPYDSRFNKVELTKIVPHSGVVDTSTQIEFSIEKKKTECYLLSDMLFECSITILEDTEVATLPLKTTEVGPVNNILHSLFSRVNVKLNGTDITNTPDYYNYRSYLQTLLTYGTDSKNSHLQTVGWATDTKRNMETECTSQLPYVPKNAGWWHRCNMFKKDEEVKTAVEYRKNGATFIGRLNHELIQSSKPLPPGTSINICLLRSTDDFFLMRKKGDTKKYKTIINSICLYLPVCSMQQRMIDELDIRWPKEPITYHYRRFNVTRFGINVNKKEYSSPRIFGESSNPIRLYLFLVESAAAVGTQDSNPYNFGRSWTYSTSIQRLALEDQLQERETQNEIRSLKNMMRHMMNTLEAVQSGLPTADPEELPLGRKKGVNPVKRTTRSTQQENEREETTAIASGSEGATSNSFFSNMANMFRRNSQSPSEEEEFEIIDKAAELLQKRQTEIERNKQGSSRSVRDSDSVSIASDYQQRRLEEQRDLRDPTIKSFWIEEIQLKLGGTVIGCYTLCY